ncbi:MAG: TRAP transporter substrate-binding protein DctP [Synergistales bacterium]|nr:TRAP transporter substrate-binding protein DctP [Synergistales bacterium]
MKLLRIAVLAIFCVAMAAGFALAADDTVTLKLSTHHPGGVYRSVGARLLKEEIEKATDGKVKIDIYYSESLAAGGEVLDSVKMGIVDIGDVNPAYYPGQLPIHSGLLVYTESPPKHMQKVEVMDRMYKNYPVVEEEIEQYNQRILWQYFPTPLALSSTKPVDDIDDFKGMKIRASSEAYLRMLGDLGATPVSVPFTDCYMAMQTGTINAVFTNIAACSGQKFYEVAPYTFTSQKLGLWLAFTYTINQDVWDGFSRETKDQISAAVEKVNERFGPMFDSEYQNQVELFREKGEEVVMADEEDVKTWQNLPIISTLKQELAEKAEDAGVENGDQFIKDVGMYMEEAKQ